MQRIICMCVMAAAVACSAEEPVGRDKPLAGNDGIAAQSASLTPAPADEPESAVVAQDELPMLGELPGVGSFKSVGRIRLSSGLRDANQVNILVSGVMSAGFQLGLTQSLTAEQAKALAGGATVQLNGLSGMSYGPPTKQVTRALQSVQLSVAADGTATLRFGLGNVVAQDPGAPPAQNAASQVVFTGVLHMECLVPGQAEKEQTRDDPRLTTPFCQGLLRKLSLHGLAQQLY